MVIVFILQSKVVGDRVVVVSNSTAVLDIVEGMCIARQHKSFRLDGSTDSDKRQPMVRVSCLSLMFDW